MSRVGRTVVRVGAVVALSALQQSGIITATSAASAAPVQSSSIQIRQTWSVPISDPGAPIAESSPTVATLDNRGPSVVVGDRAGHIYALHVSDGSEVAGWPVSTGAAVDSAVSSLGSTVFAGEGTSSNLYSGGYASYAANGAQRWFRTIALAPPGLPQSVGVQSGLAVGLLGGQAAVVSGSMGQFADALTIGSGAILPGFPFWNADSDFATPALADLYRNGATEIVEGGDSTANPDPRVVDELGRPFTNGGHIRVLSGSGQLLCEYNTNQVVQSSPAVGSFLAGSAVGVVAGTGGYYAGASNTNQVLALNAGCGLAWQTTLDGVTTSSPALVDALGNHELQVAEGTNIGGALQHGSVWLLNGADGRPIWRSPALGAIIGSLVSVDLGGGYQDLVAATTQGAEIFDGRTGRVIWTQGGPYQNSPLVTADPNGTVGITFAGYTATGSQVTHFEVTGVSNRVVGEARSWPMFHHDAQLSGDAGTAAAPVQVPCKSPPPPPNGYWLAATDGGVFTYGDLQFCGSTGKIALNKPIVGISGTPDGGGYWLVASDGGIFTFGDAHFYGSTGAMRLNRPIVGMARTADGRGYWLVASDGGIFTFGDARYYGSTGAMRLTKPVVGMAPAPDGRGYWLVASDGGIFTFGDARFRGSEGGVRLNRPMVGMAATPSGNGYWLVASDGGIFTFGDARFRGSEGGIRLNRPIVGMAATPSGNGYWLVASDGGIFTFGDARFLGSAGGIHLAQPVVAMSGY